MKLRVSTSLLFAVLVAALLACAPLLVAQETVKENSTGKFFPVSITISHDGKTIPLTLTGTTVRKKLIIKVYAAAHYMQDPPTGKEQDLYAAVLADGKAKQLTMEFVREVGMDKIRNAYRDGFEENSTKEELKTIAPLVEQFVGYFATDVKENDRFIVRWLPGGVVQAQVQGTEKPAITNPLFARILWSIWFGEDSIVDREELVSRFLK
jgi:hypothetical protein